MVERDRGEGTGERGGGEESGRGMGERGGGEG